MPKINVLDKQVAELIAAGEVIERPASVIKELVENSIDSGADTITVEIMQGGITYMRVSDNGCGIERADVPKAFLRHATSKVISGDDLERIMTLGFRGEALASICAVSRVQILTRCSCEEIGTSYFISAENPSGPHDTGCPTGTTIIVRDLFYNVPARMKFLKKDVTEGAAISTLMDRLAISHPEISFRYIKDREEKFCTPGKGDMESAIFAVYGPEFMDGLTGVSYSFGGISIEGFITRPECSRGTRSMQHFFINRRFIKSVTMMSALEQAYRNSIMTGKFPACVLFADIPPEVVDVNVHPAKLEVKLSDEKFVFDAVYSACHMALASLSNVTPAFGKTKKKLSYYEITQKQITGEQQHMTAKQYREMQSEIPSAADSAKNKNSFESFCKNDRNAVSDKYNADMPAITKQAKADKTGHTMSLSADVPNWQKIYSAVTPKSLTEEKPKKILLTEPENAESAKDGIVPEKADSQTASEISEAKETADENPVKYLGELFSTNLLGEKDSSFFLADKHAAHERIIFNKLKKESETDKPARQILLGAVRMSLDKNLCELLLENSQLLEKVGFAVEDFGVGCISVTEIPMIIDVGSVEEIIGDIARQLESNSTRPMPQMIDNIYHSIACKAAIKGNMATSYEENAALLSKIMSDPQLRNCPHGRPVILELTKREIEKLFSRIV